MAFALPSFNAAVASANTSGLPLQRLQSAIDFGDVDSTYATKMLGKVSLENFVTEANLAKQALNEYGAGLRNKMTLDYNREVLDSRKEELEEGRNSARRAKLFEMLMGGAEGLLGGEQQGQPQYQDPRVNQALDLSYRRLMNENSQYEMGGLHPDIATKAVLLQSGQIVPKTTMPGSGANKQIQGIYQVQPASVPKLEAPKPTSVGDLYKRLLQAGNAGRSTQEK